MAHKSAILILGHHPIGRTLAPKLKALEGLALAHFIGIGYLLEYSAQRRNNSPDALLSREKGEI